MSPFRRYAPFAVVVAVQALLVVVAPSHGKSSATQLGGSFQGSAQSLGAGGQAGAAGAQAGQPGAVPGGAGTGAGTAGSASSGGATAAGQAGNAAAAGAHAAGGSACVTGLLEHPPCAPKWSGGDNGGATAPGVTAKSITVVMYRAKDNPAVDAITKASGAYTSPSAEQAFLKAAEKWINQHYQLYGRQLHFVHVTGTCDIAPPSDSCFRAEADSIVSTYKPFALFWDTDASEAAFFDELSRKGVVNWGGWNFSDQFDQSLRPYHYDALMGGDAQAEITGEWWCKRLANHKARYAGGTLKSQLRKVAIVYPDSPVIAPAAQHLAQVIKGCDKNGAMLDSYSQDTSTAASQSTTNTAKLKQAGITSILWFSDPIAPAYGTKQQTAQNYFPEEVLVGSGLLDYDSLAQNYDQKAWAHAFGPSDIAQFVPLAESDAARVWKGAGMSGLPDPNSNLEWTYMALLSSGVMAAGPHLTAMSYEYGLLTAPGYDSYAQYHDPRLEYVKFGKGDYTAVSDIREVYWDPNKPSPVNGKAGTYVELNGGARYQPGQVPSGEPSLPIGG